MNFRYIYECISLDIIVSIKNFFLHLAETTDPPEKCNFCGDDAPDIWPHVKGHRISRNERKLLRSYYKLKQDGSRLRLVWTGFRENVDVPLNQLDSPKANKLDSPKAKRPQKPEVKKKRNFRRALTTFREPQPPNNVKEAVNLFLDLQTNGSPKDVAKRLEDAEYILEKNM